MIPLISAEEVDEQTLKYLNRLSDFLFTIARYAAMFDNEPEMIYRRPDVRGKTYKAGPDGLWKKAEGDKFSKKKVEDSNTTQS